MSADSDTGKMSNAKKSRKSKDGDEKLEISMLESIFGDAGISDKRLECPFKPLVNHFGIFFPSIFVDK